MTEGGALSLEHAAALIGAYSWIEARLFQLTGAWAGAADRPEIQILLDEVSTEHAWHAELFAERLPVLDWVDADTLVVPPSAGVASMLEALDDPALSAAARVDVLAAVVLPRLIATYERHLARAAPVADRPVMRALRLVLTDEREEVEAAGALGPGGAGRSEGESNRRRFESMAAAEAPDGTLVAWPEPAGPVRGAR